MKTLVYYTVGCSRGYIEMLELSIVSLRKVYTGDVAVLCDESFLEECSQRFPDIAWHTLPDSKSGPDASMNKVKIFDFVSDDEYDAVLYLDTDILVMNPLTPYFETITNPDTLYVYTERQNQYDHTFLYFSLQTYTERDYAFLRDRGILPFNAGTFAFIPSAEMRTHFDNVRALIRSHTGPYFYEQSHMNVYFNLQDKTDRTVFTPDTYVFVPKKGVVYPKGILFHFAGEGESASVKCEHMRNYLAGWETHQMYLRGPVQVFETRVDMLSLVHPYGVYAEIGVFEGLFSDTLCKKLQPTRLVLLDLFSGIIDSGDQDGNNVKQADTSVVYKRLLAVSRRFPALEVVKGDSSTQLARYPDQTFDMIYLDGDHTYQGVKKDLEVAYAKVRSCGWIMGHDYEMNPAKTTSVYEFGVKQAVDEFCKIRNVQIAAKGMDGCVSYAIYIVKP